MMYREVGFVKTQAHLDMGILDWKSIVQNKLSHFYPCEGSKPTSLTTNTFPWKKGSKPNPTKTLIINT